MILTDLNPQTLLMKVVAWLAIIGLVIFGLWATADHFENVGYQKAKNEYTAQALKDTQAARLKEQTLQTKLNEAQNARSKAENALLASAVANRNAVNQLRQQLDTTNRNLSSYSSAALAARVTTLSTVLEECTSQYIELATKADGHVADLKLMEDAWPK